MALLFAATYPGRTSALVLYGSYAKALNAPDYSHGHQVLISRTLADLLAGSDIVLTDEGEHELKGIADPWRLFSSSDREAAPKQP